MTFQVSISKAVTKLQRVRILFTGEDITELVGSEQRELIKENIDRGGIEESWRAMSPNTLVKGGSRSGGNRFESGFSSSLKRSIRIRSQGSDKVTVEVTHRLAPLHHFGVGPHTIRAKRAEFLRFKTVQGIVFVKQVNHPGIPARPLIPSARFMRAQSLTILGRFKEKIRQIGRA